MFQYVGTVKKSKIPPSITRVVENDPTIVLIALGSLAVLALSVFFCLVFSPGWRFVTFALVFFPSALPIGFYFGRIKRSLVLKHIEEEKEEEETKKLEPPKKKKEGKKLSQYEMSKELSKWASKSELQKSIDAQKIRDLKTDDEEDEDDD
jgi:hypothetical protein